MSSNSQAPDLKGLHREMHGIAEHIRIMNKNNARLIQHIAVNNSPPPTAPVPEEINLSFRSHRLGDDESLSRQSTEGDEDQGFIQVQITNSSRGIRRKDGSDGPPDLYKNLMILQEYSNEVMCKAFSATLKGLARSWFRKLSPQTIDSFGDLSKLFVANFISCRVRQKNASHLFTVHQKDGESLKDYVKPQVLMEIKNEKFVRWPGEIKTNPFKRNKNKYCEFYRDHGHNTEDCFQLKEQIVDLIKEGYLRKFVTDCPQHDSSDRRYGDNLPITGDIQTIHRGFESRRCSSLSRMRHTRDANGRAEEEVYNLSASTTEAHQPIIFTNDDLRGLHFFHDDALVIFAIIANFNVQRKLVDNGSSANILFILAFDKIKTGQDRLHPFHTLLVGFGGSATHPLRSPYAWKNQGNHLHLSLDDEILHFNRGRRGLYCYKVIPFGLKNTGMTYQRLVNKMFKEMIGKTMEVYIDNMLVKSLKSADYIAHLEETFGILRKHQMMLNPSKCIFSALLALSSPRNIHEVQQMTGRVAALSRFISKSADKCLSFFKILRKNTAFEWTNEFEMSFQQLKKYLGSHPLLTVHSLGEELILYLSISPTITKDSDQGQVLADFITEFTHDDAPNPEMTLLEIKTLEEQNSDEDLARWKLFVDGSSNQHSYGAGLVLRTPSGEQLDYFIRIGFKATNNEVEYETFLIELRVATELGVESLDAFYDSQLVIKNFKIRQIPREKNKKADALDNLASAFNFISDKIIPMEFLPNPSIDVTKTIYLSCNRRTDVDERHYCIPPRWNTAIRQTPSSPDSISIFQILPSSWNFVQEVILKRMGKWKSPGQTILRTLKARLEKSKGEWAENLLGILWVYHTTSRIPTGETPYSMEINEGELKFNIDLHDERREQVEVRHAAYKHQDAKYYNQRVKHRSFLASDLVLRKITLSTKELNVGKLSPTWEGPYKVVKVSRPGTYWLEDMSRKALPHP
ncbi:hypothetical protein Acr_07g0017660 [Actinidia rufa]|uniref:Uncharacterized protein n=1 Tax=Actinidia rufa TaxID=165716 RepID=A0A7J0EYS7_9ERIC|nr:hypothetical protein Acr_07g0017660 [Actinidia rufa]